MATHPNVHAQISQRKNIPHSVAYCDRVAICSSQWRSSTAIPDTRFWWLDNIMRRFTFLTPFSTILTVAALSSFCFTVQSSDKPWIRSRRLTEKERIKSRRKKKQIQIKVKPKNVSNLTSILYFVPNSLISKAKVLKNSRGFEEPLVSRSALALARSRCSRSLEK